MAKKGVTIQQFNDHVNSVSASMKHGNRKDYLMYIGYAKKVKEKIYASYYKSQKQKNR